MSDDRVAKARAELREAHNAWIAARERLWHAEQEFDAALETQQAQT